MNPSEKHMKIIENLRFETRCRQTYLIPVVHDAYYYFFTIKILFSLPINIIVYGIW